MSTKGSKRILLETLEIDEQDITLGVICQKVLHHAEDSLRDVQDSNILRYGRCTDRNTVRSSSNP